MVLDNEFAETARTDDEKVAVAGRKLGVAAASAVRFPDAFKA